MTREDLAHLGTTAEQLDHLRGTVPELHSWYRASARDLPWRRTRAPYPIWVSEVMLQQTRVAAVVPYYERWMGQFPSIQTLARAPLEEVLKVWEGLGYYSRARNLHRAAQVVCDRFHGEIPGDPTRFRELPGVGAYTAAAVLSIAFGADLAVVDGNVARVLCRVLALHVDPRRAPHAHALARLAQELLPAGTAATHNQSLMELGATICTPNPPACTACPLNEVCEGTATGEPGRFPKKKAKPAVPHHQVVVGIVLRDGQVFIDRRPYGGLLGGLWEFPGGKVEAGETLEQTLHRELYEEFGLRVTVEDHLDPVDHAYTHLKVTLHPWVCRFHDMEPRVGEGNPWKWVEPAELERVPMPRANRKVLEQLCRRWESLLGAPG